MLNDIPEMNIEGKMEGDEDEGDKENKLLYCVICSWRGYKKIFQNNFTRTFRCICIFFIFFKFPFSLITYVFNEDRITIYSFVK